MSVLRLFLPEQAHLLIQLKFACFAKSSYKQGQPLLYSNDFILLF